MFVERLTQHRQNVAQLDASAGSLTLQLERGPQRISEETIANVRMDNQTIHIQASKAALGSVVVRDGDAANSMVPDFDRKWCRLQDSNL